MFIFCKLYCSSKSNRKMKTKVLLFTPLFLLFVASSCIFMGPSIKGDGNVVKENRSLDDFDQIEVSRGMNVYISQSTATSVTVEADENLLDAIETKVSGDVLEIKALKNIRNATAKKVFVTVPEISAISTSSGSNVFSETALVAEHLELKSSSGSNLKLELKARRTEAKTSSGSNITLSGNTETFEGEASSGSNIFGEDFATKKCDAQASSGSNIWIRVENELIGKASSGANVFYFGQPQTESIEKSSGGNVIKK